MPYNPLIHHRRSIRLKGYDYSKARLYFVTICIQHHTCLLGHITDGEMILNDAGHMIERWYFELENKYPDIRCGPHITMPNHFHCIIENMGGDLDGDAGANMGDACGEMGGDLNRDAGGDLDCNLDADAGGIFDGDLGANMGDAFGDAGGDLDGDMDLGAEIDGNMGGDMDSERGGHTGPPLRTGGPMCPPDIPDPPALGRIIQWLKTMTTNEYIRGVKNLGWPRFNQKLWQRNYWERIIRDDGELQRITTYIHNNPKNWKKDKLK